MAVYEEGGSKRSVWVTITSKPERGETGRLIRVRLVAQRISGAAQQRELEAAKQRASKNGHALSEATKQETEWILVATTLPERWSDEEVLLLYRARWQIERLFKLMKSLAHLARLPTRTRREFKSLPAPLGSCSGSYKRKSSSNCARISPRLLIKI